jgi:undecaprenyl-diphosphatase
MLQAPNHAARSAQWLFAGALAGLAGFIGILTFVALTGGVDRLDRFLVVTAVHSRTSPLTSMASAATALGTFPVVIGVTLMAAVIALVRHRRPGVVAILVGAVSTVVPTVFLLKIAIGRARPDAVLFGSQALDYSFPSGHTADGSIAWLLGAVTATLGLRPGIRRPIIVAAAGLCLAIGWSRVYLGYHWPTDVVASWLFAGAATCVAILIRGVSLLRPPRVVED